MVFLVVSYGGRGWGFCCVVGLIQCLSCSEKLWADRGSLLLGAWVLRIQPQILILKIQPFD